MQKIKIALLKLLYYIFVLPFSWLVSKFHREKHEDRLLLEELEKARQLSDENIRRAIALKIEQLPQNYQEHFHKLNITGLQFFVAIRAIQLLLARTFRRHNLGKKHGALLTGAIGFDKISFLTRGPITQDCDIFIPSSTVIHEVARFARVSEETAVKIIFFIVCAYQHVDELIPNFKRLKNEYGLAVILVPDK